MVGNSRVLDDKQLDLDMDRQKGFRTAAMQSILGTFERQALLVDQPVPQPNPTNPSAGNRNLLVRYPWPRLPNSVQGKRFHFD